MVEKYKNKYRIKSTRLEGYNYSRAGLYFITICTNNRLNLFGKIDDNGKMELNDSGKMINFWWSEIETHFEWCKINEFIIMPNHIHGIIEIIETPVEIDRRVNLRHHQRNENAKIKNDDGNNNLKDLNHLNNLKSNDNENDYLNDNENNNENDNLNDLNSNDNSNDNENNYSNENENSRTMNSPIFDNQKKIYRIENRQTRRSVSTAYTPSITETTFGGKMVGLFKIIQWFKTMTTNMYIRGVKNDHWKPFYKKLWQSKYWDHIIRNEKENIRISNYIINNPKKWFTDKLNNGKGNIVI